MTIKKGSFPITKMIQQNKRMFSMMDCFQFLKVFDASNIVPSNMWAFSVEELECKQHFMHHKILRGGEIFKYKTVICHK